MATEENYKEFIEIIDLGLSIGNFMGSALEDGKLNFSDFREFFPVIEKVIPAIDGAENAMKVIHNGLTVEQYTHLETHILENFDIPQDNIEEAIEFAISAVLDLFNLVKLFKK